MIVRNRGLRASGRRRRAGSLTRIVTPIASSIRDPSATAVLTGTRLRVVPGMSAVAMFCEVCVSCLCGTERAEAALLDANLNTRDSAAVV